MPDQTCANGLHIPTIPKELQDITPLDRQIISPCIPFSTMLIMRKYGGHYKVNGSCVDVPPTLDQVIHMLPYMSDQLQLHPVKLKRNLKYKGHYMFHLIQKDKVMGTIIWLKYNNSHYKKYQTK